jgi:hypothetical protein
MAADDLSAAGLSPVTWMDPASQQGSRRDTGDKARKGNSKREGDAVSRSHLIPDAPRKKAKTRKFVSSDIEFEHPEHELDSIA